MMKIFLVSLMLSYTVGHKIHVNCQVGTDISNVPFQKVQNSTTLSCINPW